MVNEFVCLERIYCMLSTFINQVDDTNQLYYNKLRLARYYVITNLKLGKIKVRTYKISVRHDLLDGGNVCNWG